MDTSNLRPTQCTSTDDPTMESGDWRAQLQRQRITNKIRDTLTRHLPFSGYERLQELREIAGRIEEEIYAAATSQSEYSRMICFMMLSIETRLQNPITDPMWSNSASVVPFDSRTQTGNQNGRNWQEEVYQKIKAMKEVYLLDLNPIQDACGTVFDPSIKSGDWRALLPAGSRERIKHKILDTLRRHLPFNGDEGLRELKKIAARFEERIYTTATSQSDYLRKMSSKMLPMENR